MALTIGDRSTLQRVEDWRGHMAEQQGRRTSLSRTSNHLGTLANALKDLGGGASLLNELTQNGDDAGADTVRFTVTPEALVVWNSGSFSDCGHDDPPPCPWKVEGRRSCDLHSFRDVSGRNKELDSQTTGAFGIGFTAVYQMTDHPELLINGRHLLLDESAPEDDRIQICVGGCSREHTATGTTLILPWAREDSRLRRELGVSPLTDGDIAALTAEIRDTVVQAAVFLRNVTKIEVVEANGTTSVLREAAEDRIRIRCGSEVQEWLLLEGETPIADDLKRRYDQIPAGRTGRVQVALPIGHSVVGRIYAGLPTETPTGWDGHLNATFFPRQDRKGIEFDVAGHRGRWNDALIDAAALTLAQSLEQMLSAVGVQAVWEYLVQVESLGQDVTKGAAPACFIAFRDRARHLAPAAEIAFTMDGTRTAMMETYLPPGPDDYAAASALTRLGLPVLDESLRSSAFRLPGEYGIARLSISDIVDTLSAAGLNSPWVPGADSPADADEVVEILRLVQKLQERGKNLLTDSDIETVAVIPCLDGSFSPASHVSRLDESDRALFELLDPALKVLDENRLVECCPSLVPLCDDITPYRAIEIFERDVEALAVAPLEVLEWLADHRSAMEDSAMKVRVRALPVFPSAGGEYRPLTELSLPSSFRDPLSIASVVDRDRTRGYEDLLRLLGCRELDVADYLRVHALPFANQFRLSPQQAVAILDIVSRGRDELDEHPDLQEALGAAPLVLCTDGTIRAAVDVHLASAALSLIAPDTPTADLAEIPDRLVGALSWLGVSAVPNHETLDGAARRLATQEEDPEEAVVVAILGALPESLTPSVPRSLEALATEPWLPVEGGGRAAPHQVYASFRREVFESQGPRLGVSRIEQNRLAAQLSWIGVHRNPTTSMVINHLRHCAATESEMHQDVYRFLGEAKGDETQVRRLASERCVQVSPGHFVEPGFVFWSDEGLGRWAHVLPPVHRQFGAFFDLVGVTERPAAAHLEGLLRFIGRECGHDELEEDDKSVVHRCWELLDDYLSSPVKRPEADRIIRQLGPVRCVVDNRGLLARPDQLLFLDGRRLAEKFLLLSQSLVRRAAATENALLTAGVRAAEDVIITMLDTGQDSSPADGMAGLIADRMTAIRRLFAAADLTDSQANPEAAAEVEYRRMPGLRVKYQATFANHIEETQFENAEAAYMEESGQLLVRSEGPSRAAARELVRCIAPRVDVMALASSLFEILTAPSLDAAMGVLDEYGVQDLDDRYWELVPSGEALLRETGDWVADQPAGSTTDLDTDGVGSDPQLDPDPDHEPDSQSGANEERFGSRDRAGSSESDRSGGPRSRSEAGRNRDARRQQRRTHLLSYVLLGDVADHEPDDSGDEAAARSAVDMAGVQRVVDYELACGRAPEEQEHHNRGFDIVSKDPEGRVLRWIEVKSIGGEWTEAGVLMSRAQLEENQARGTQFWLYVVERAQDDDAFEIHRINDPWSQAAKFGFDSGWRGAAEPNVDRDESGTPLVGATRRLLGWGSKADTSDR